MLKFSNEINGMIINIQIKTKVVDAATFLDEFKTMFKVFIFFFSVPFLLFFFSKLTALQKLFSAVYTVARYQSTSIYHYMRKYNKLRLSAANKRSVFVTCTVLECQLNCGAIFNW